MMTKDQIDRVLKKSNPTGKEIGRLHLEKLFSDFSLAKQGKPSDQLFTNDDIQRMVQTLTEQKDLTDYMTFLNMRNSMFDLLTRVEMNVQQAYHGVYAAIAQLNEIKNADLEKREKDTAPVVMTMGQYNRLREDATQNLREQKVSMGKVLVWCLSNFLLADSDVAREEDVAIFSAIEKSKVTPVADSYVLQDYIKRYCLYFVLPDGTQSNLVSKDEWERAYNAEYRKIRQVPTEQSIEQVIQSDQLNHLSKQYELFFKGVQSIRQYVKDLTGRELNFDDGVIEDAMDSILIESNPTDERVADAKEQLLKCWDIVPIETRYGNPPEALTLYNLLPFFVERFSNHPSEQMEVLEHLRVEATELYSALSSYVERQMPSIKDMGISELCERSISWEELHKLGLLGMADILTPSDEDIINVVARGNTTKDLSLWYRAKHNGIAIMLDSTGLNGENYEEKTLKTESIYTLSQQGKKARFTKILSYYVNMITPSFKYVYGFNVLLEILSKVFKIPDFKDIFTYNTTTLELRVTELNNLLTRTYHDVYGNKADKLAKRLTIKSAFEFVELDQLKPTPSMIKAESKKITHIVSLPDGYQYMQALERFVLDLMVK